MSLVGLLAKIQFSCVMLRVVTAYVDCYGPSKVGPVFEHRTLNLHEGDKTRRFNRFIPEKIFSGAHCKEASRTPEPISKPYSQRANADLTGSGQVPLSSCEHLQLF